MTPTADKSVVLLVVGFLGLIALTGVWGLLWLVDHGADAEALLPVVAIISAAAGSLGTLLASTRTTTIAVQEAKAEGYAEAVAHVDALAPGPQQVQVVNPADAPVPVAETPRK
jgi:hypothetical protein